MLNVARLGPCSYRDGLALQAGLVEARAAGRTGDWLLYPDHPPVLTVGRNPSAGSLLADRASLERQGIELFEVARGGDITWHGPGQLVGYLVVDLGPRDRDVHRFLRDIEEALIATVRGFGLPASREPGKTGVWVEGEKIASIGVAVRRWVSYHGFALNVAPDLRFFDLIHPCGLRGIKMASLAGRMGPEAPTMAEAAAAVAEAMALRFAPDGWTWKDPDEARRLAGPSEERTAGPRPLTRGASC
jgi:lipoate-protein ligase B